MPIQTAVIPDIWLLHKDGIVIGVTTCCTINHWKELIMGAGIAEEAKRRFPHLPKRWADLKPVEEVLFDRSLNLIRIPTKYDWRKLSPIELVRTSIQQLIKVARLASYNKFAVPPPGCGLGGLSWDFQVKKMFDAEDPPPNLKVFFRTAKQEVKS